MIKRFTLIAILVLMRLSLFAQNWGGGVDNELLHFGFTFQYISSEYKILKKKDWRAPFTDPETNALVSDSLYSISSPPTPGFGLGFVSDLALGDHANLRFTPAMVFTDRLLDYNYLDTTQFRQKKVSATMIDLPIGIKLKSDRRNNFRAYLIGGLKYSVDIISKKKTNDEGLDFSEKFVKNKRGILSYEAGIGFDFYFEFFKLSPEIKLSNSVNSVLKSEVNPYSSPLDKLFLRNLQFSLYFE
ncbi:outer membrane beta-barrel protein [Rubrolithibacter danxiaensis]|uniref:type IX secretion/gliding motility protein PorT/SprT n=1 Tax=Rubrolithibacter danxiaensis TaxID=3390805 RepID=UPI003BF7B99A